MNIFTGACVPPESSFITYLEGNYGNWRPEDIGSGREGKFVRDLVRARKFENWQMDVKDIEKRIRLIGPKTYAELVAIPYRLYAERMGKNPDDWGDKNNIHGLLINQLITIFPKAKFIHIVRNPLQIYASLKRLSAVNFQHALAPTIPDTVEDFCDVWEAYSDKTQAALTGRTNVLRITFEQILEDQWKVLESTAAFLGVTYMDEKTHSPVDQKAWKTPEHKYVWKSRSPLEFDPAVSSNYEATLSKAEIVFIKMRLQERAQILGIDLIP